MKPIRVLVVDDHEIARQGIRLMAKMEPTIELVGEAVDGHDAIRQARRLEPDVILMDVVMPKLNGLEALAQIKNLLPATKIIILTGFVDDAQIKAAMQNGADGYLLKSADSVAVIRAIQSAYRGDMTFSPQITRQIINHTSPQAAPPPLASLSDREMEVLAHIANGLNNKEIAKILGLSHGTVKIYVSNILGKLGVAGRTEAAVLAAQYGLLPPNSDTGAE